jgi:GDP-L-fucose synthase
MSIDLNGKNVLVTGGTGMVGQPLVELLIEEGCDVTVVSLDDPSRVQQESITFVQSDLRDFNNCLEVTKNQDIVFHVAGVKGSPLLTRSKPASFFVPMLQFNTNVLEAARINNVEWSLYTSTVGVYGPSEVFREDDLWEQMPSKNDWFAGWAKRVGELQVEAYNIQYGESNTSIVRPVNIYGRYDNFNPQTSMVIPSLIYRALKSRDVLDVWGDGSPLRDFINARDVAAAMVFCVKNQVTEPVNVGNGKGISIRELVETIVDNVPHALEIEWDTSKPMGDKARVADTSRINGFGFHPEVTLEAGIKDTIEWYLENTTDVDKRYEVFNG